MKIKKILGLIVALCALSTFAFADEAKYKELLAKAKDYESKQMWVYSMGTYWDAILEYPQGAKEAYESFWRIRAGFGKRVSNGNFYGTGNPGPGKYDIFSSYDGWIKLCKEFEIYWNEHSDEIYYISKVECKKGEANMKTRTMTYGFQCELSLTAKFSLICECIEGSLSAADKKNWDAIPKQWPAVSMFKDSKTIPVVKFISACSDKLPEESRYYSGKPKLETLTFRDLYSCVIVGGGVHSEDQRGFLEFPPYESKEYYVAAWNNRFAIGTIKGKSNETLSNLETKIKILDKNGRIIASNNASGALDFEISGISSDDMKILDSGEWSYKVESIVIKSKNAVAENKKPEFTDREIKFASVKYSNGPVINMYRAENDSYALAEYEAVPFVTNLYNTYTVEKSIHKVLRNNNERNCYIYVCSDDTVDGEIFTMLLSGKNRVVQDRGYAGKYVHTEIHFDEQVFYPDEFLKVMNKMYNAEFELGYIPDTKKWCIYCATISDEIKHIVADRIAADKKAEEERISEEKKAEEMELKLFAEKDFYGDKKIREVIIPKGVKEIRRKAFWDCTSLEKVSIPDGVTYIGDAAFYGCTSLESLTIPNSVTYIGGDAFHDCTSLRSVTIPNGVTAIGSSTFIRCKNLNSISIPESVKSIGNDAFYGCDVLKITFAGTKAHWMSMYRVSGKVVVHCSDGDVDNNLYNTITEITIPDGVISIGKKAFGGCKLLEKVTIPSSVTYIGSDAFGACSSLTSVTIPDSVTYIGDHAFGVCTSLKSVIIPVNLKKIDYKVFEECSSLSSVTIPKSVKIIEKNAFYGCVNLKTVDYAGNKDDWKKIEINKKDKSNKELLKATINFQSK